MTTIVPGFDDGKSAEAGSRDDSTDLSMMARALEIAREGRNLGEVPVGALVVHLDGSSRRPTTCARP